MTNKFVMVQRHDLEWLVKHLDAPEKAARNKYRGIEAIKYVAARLLSAAPPATQGESGHGASDCNEERTIRETLVPCDCGCGRSCCAGCGADLGYLKAPPAIAAGPVDDANDELCAKCNFTREGHIGNTGVIYPCWTPSGKYKQRTAALGPQTAVSVTDEARMVRAWRNRFISERTAYYQREGKGYEEAIAYAESDANDYAAALEKEHD